jgi:two-component system, cell cycle sensor histidine kinase and response regulator CckA
MSNIGRKTFAMATGLGFLAYLADAYLDWLYYDKAFWSLLFTDVPVHQLYSRLITVFLFASFGAFAARLCSKLCHERNELAEDEDAQRFRSFVENANDIVYTLSLDGIFTYVSPNWQDCLGVPAEDVTGKPFAPAVHPDDVHLCNDFLREVSQGSGKQDSVEYRVRHRDGSWRWHISKGSPIFDQDGNVVSYVGIARDVTEHRQAVQKLVESEQKYRELYERAPVAIFTTNSQGQVIECNPAGARILGFTDSEQAISHYSNVASQIYANGDDRIEFKRSLEKNGSIENFECEARTVNGRSIWLSMNARLTKLKDDGSFEIEGFAIEVTEHKLAERALAQSEQKFRELFERAPICIFTTSSKGRFISCNPATAAIFGFDSPEHLIEHIDNIGTQIYANSDRRLEFLRLMSENGKVENFDFEVNSANGRTRWLEMNAGLVNRKDDGSYTVEGFAQDITERKKAEAERERLLSAIEQTGEIVLITDSKGMIEYVNPAFERITGYSRKEALGENPNILRSEKQDETFYNEMWQVISSGRTWTGQLVNKRKDGTLFTEETTISPMRDENGDIAHYVAVKHDITEHLRIREEKSKLEAQFQQAQKLESIGRLAGGVAHDLNNLLSPILGYGEMILEDLQENSSLKPSVEEIVNAGGRARDLVRQLLAFSRKQVLEFKPVELNRILKKFESLLLHTIREDVIINIAADVPIPMILGDSGQLEQVVMNLAVNAQDAMSDGGKLTIETMVVELDAGYTAQKQGVKPGEYVMLAISDTGCGIKPDIVEHIFEPFFTTKNKEEGTGLGLATVYGIVKQHGGNIWVYSEPGKGTTFKIYFPVSRNAGLTVSNDVVVAANFHGSETILLVEDNEQVRNLTLKILKRLDYNVLVAESGDGALTLLEQHDGPVHLLLTDVIMPEMNGRDLFDRVSSLETGVKVLFMSGYTDNVIAHHGIIDEGVNFIQKPFSVQTLAAKVREVLGG